jgi:uncharacterized membrane protein YcaP (DUF421 family)
LNANLLTQVFDGPTLAGGLIIAAKTTVVYLFLVAGLRLLGKRELGQMTVYDLVMIVVVGNAVQNAMMNNDNTLFGGVISAITLLTLNRLLNILIRRSKKVERMMVGQPVLLVSHGKPLKHNLDREGLTTDELEAALREHGMTDVGDAQTMILEVDGSISVIPGDSKVLRTRRHYKAVRLP